MSFNVDDKVEWDWGQGTADGRVKETHTKKITRKIKGSEVTRNGSSDDPAIVVEQENGDEVLKLASELRHK